MAQNDYFVIVYQVLKYLYECLKTAGRILVTLVMS